MTEESRPAAVEPVAPLPSTSEARYVAFKDWYANAPTRRRGRFSAFEAGIAFERAIRAAAMAEAQDRIEARDNDEDARTEGYEARVRPAHFAVYHDQDWYNAGWTDALRALLAPVEEAKP
jgi:hypothetical protein